jgi:hypothetical protein
MRNDDRLDKLILVLSAAVVLAGVVRQTLMPR